MADGADDSEAEPGAETDADADVVTLTVIDGDERHELAVERGRNLRRVLLDADLSPYTALTSSLNCGGRGICATCGVRVLEAVPTEHWHDRAAARFGYPRLSCQTPVSEALTVRLVEDKRVWGGREG